MSMFELVLAMMLGNLAGILVGILPGIGPTALLVMTYPALSYFELWPLFIFYFALLNASQYYGSVSATVYGVAGELSSIPAVRNGHHLFNQGQGDTALIYAATGSFFASLFAIVIFVSLVKLDSFSVFMSSSWRITFLITALVAIVLFTKNRLHGLIFAIIGLAIGKIGYDVLTGNRFLTFGISDLDSGLPFFPLFCGLILIPLLISGYQQSQHAGIKFHSVSFGRRINTLLNPKYIGSIFRGSIIGFFSGLIPGASYTISSNIAEWVENKFFQTKNQISQNFKNLISAESANNAGSISVLIPLVALAIPIVSSEAVLLSVAETKGFGINVSVDMLTDNIVLITLFLVLINLFNWTVSGLFYNQMVSLYRISQNYVYHLVALLCVGIMIYFAWQDYQLWLSTIVFLTSLFVGLLIKDVQSKTCFIFAYFIAEMLSDELTRYFI